MNKDPEIRSFALLLQGLEDGDLQSELTAKLKKLTLELVKQASAAGKAKGALTLKLKLIADNGGTVSIDGDVIIVEPKPLRSRTMMWVDKGGVLLAANPKQTLLPLKEVPAPKPTREVESSEQAPRSI